MSNGIGIDISGVQADDVPGDWEFVVVKSSEGLHLPNRRLDAQWRNAARTTRGLYHYAIPGTSSGVVQANYFADDALRRGFKPGKDLWQLDAEDGLNAGAHWQPFIDEFMTTARHRLGARGFLYAGWPFLQAHGLGDLASRYKWWLPAYGRNDGNVNPYAPGTPASFVVIHQFTSHGGLDRNRIVNVAAYAATTPSPVPPPAPVAKADYMPPLQLPPIASSCVHPEGGSISLGVNGGTFALPLGKPNYGSPQADGIPLEPGVIWKTIRLWQPGDPGLKDGRPGHITILKSNGAKFVY